MVDSLRVLLVDDEAAFVDLLAKRLGNRGLDAKCVYNGRDAVDMLSKEKDFDVVILDMKMPGKDGMETLKEIKQIKPNLEVIILTGHATLDSAVEGLKMDAFDYMTKPIDIELLVNKLREVNISKYKNVANIQKK